MRLIGVFTLFLISFLVFLITNFPLSVAIDLSGARSKGLSYSNAYGTIWSGGLTNTSLMGQPVGRVTFKSKPWSVLKGGLAAKLNVDGEAGIARTGMIIGLDGVVIENLTADIHVQSLVYLDPLLRQSPSNLIASAKMLKVSYAGHCIQGDADLRTDLLTAVGRQWRWSGPALSGSFACENRQMVMNIRNDEGPDDITASLTAPNLKDYSLRADISTKNSKLIQALLAIGFEKQNNRFIYQKTSNDNSELQESA